jgi:hypothetical protein
MNNKIVELLSKIYNALGTPAGWASLLVERVGLKFKLINLIDPVYAAGQPKAPMTQCTIINYGVIIGKLF